MQEQAIEMRKVKPGEKDFHMLDEYDVVCSGVHHEVFLDMYHCGEPDPTVAPKGFTLAAR